jgi:RecB family exonuclease
VEAEPESPAELIVDGHAAILVGRIDRIDYHPDLRIWQVWDYKTGENSIEPEKAHRPKGEWHDLQLPLYRHLCRSLGIEGPVRMGYIVLSKRLSEIEFRPAEWVDADYESADAKAGEIIRAIRQRVFWPPGETRVGDWSPLGAIRLVGTLS